MKLSKKIKFFIKKMKLRELDLNVLEAKSKCFDDAIGYINGSMEYEYTDAKNKNGEILVRTTKAVNYICTVDIKELLKALGVYIGDTMKLNLINK